MKKWLPLLLLIIIAGCNNTTQTLTSMAGVYNMASQSIKGPGVDTVITGQKMIKLYTGNYTMFVRLNPADAESGFGVGTYMLDSGKLKEHYIFGATDTTQTTTNYAGAIDVAKTDSGYKQVAAGIQSGNGTMSFTENYISIGDTTVSPLDGVWQQVSGYTVTGKDTTRWKDIQYKAFYRGHFLYGNLAANRAGVKETFISAGTFNITDSSYLRQTITLATDPTMHGKAFYLAIAMNGADGFTQTATMPNGDREVLVYERLKK